MKYYYLLLIILLCSLLSYNIEHLSNPCTDYLSDIAYLEHMIPHHQVAVDMSLLLQKTTNNPIMRHMCRKIIWQQNYEISLMTDMSTTLPQPISKSQVNKYYNKTKIEYYYPIKSKSKDGSCNPMFFKPNEHMKHMKNMELNDQKYLMHMVPHHQVAIDMSKRLLKHTHNDFMISLCSDIIREQENEILQMNEMLEQLYSWQYKSVM
jgi:uncharacterized protein (DUF305 family)